MTSPILLPSHIEIVEVGPRDGLQNESTVLSTETKLEFIQRALSAGLRRIEVASFVNPKRVPTMADAEAVLAGLRQYPDLHSIGLVLNVKGFERAAAAGCHEIGMAVVASDTFNQRNQGATTHESIVAWLDIAARARAAGLRYQITIAAAFGCPFEGEVPIERVIDIAKQVAQAQPVEIAVADTIGVAVPTQITELVSRLREALPGMPIRGHFHNTRNTGLANAYAAVAAGVATLDASIGGFGGCPFAPAATGNIPTEDVIYLMSRMGIHTGVNLDSLIGTAHWLSDRLGRPVPGALSKAGPFPGARAA